jgi:2-polyprenyl-3-methyl-5-hydroxy-6-metoxy-1,4-benzoquinol methylase
MSFDPYNRAHELNEAATSAIAIRLESRGEDPFFLQMLDEYLEETEPENLSLVLDVGCGAGIVGRRLASRADFHGRVVGIDRSAESLPDKGHLICKTPRLSY